MKIYTRTGDRGETSLAYGKRVPKNSLRVEGYGTVDEANSAIGVIMAALPNEEWTQPLVLELKQIQTKLFHIGSELATPADKTVHWPAKEEDVQFLETAIDWKDQQLTPLQQFILPGGHLAAAYTHLARTIVRRAERCATSVAMEEPLNPIVVRYLNRLSDYLFVLARYINQQIGLAEPVLHQE